MRKTLLTDEALCAAVREMERGLIDADLGGDVVKKRVALPNRGKSGSVRTIVATQKAGRWFFLYGFEKNDKANISDDELLFLQGVGHEWLMSSDSALSDALVQGKIEEICHEKE